MTNLKLPIETETVIMRHFEPADLDQLKAYIGQMDVQRYMTGVMRDRKDPSDALQALCDHVTLRRPGDVFSLAIVSKKHGKIIGHVSLTWQDATAGQGEITFLLHPHFAGQGFAKEAISNVLDVAFGHFRIHRVFARCEGRNHHSAKLFEQLGMRLEAHYREHALFQGEWDEELHFAILDREWRQSSKVRQLPPRIRVA